MRRSPTPAAGPRSAPSGPAPAGARRGAAQAARRRRRSAERRGRRRELGRRAHPGGEAFPVPHGAEADRRRRRRDAARARRAGRSALQPARLLGAAARRQSISPSATRYIVVNIPSAAVDAVENGRVARRYIAIVGGVDHPSPEVEARIGAVNLNPTWTVPVSIIKNEIMPEDAEEPVLSRAGANPRPRQSREPRSIPSIDQLVERARRQLHAAPGFRASAIRSARSASPCPTSTPSTCTTRRRKRLFASDYRFLSHGCVRVRASMISPPGCCEGPAAGGQWDRAAIMARIAGGERQDVTLPARAGDLGLYDRLGLGRWNRAFPQRRLWGRRGGGGAGRPLKARASVPSPAGGSKAARLKSGRMRARRFNPARWTSSSSNKTQYLSSAPSSDPR